MSVVYPHRVAFLERGICNVCGSQGKELIHTNMNRYFGWESCDSPDCNSTIRTWYTQTTIPYEKLVAQFISPLVVKRSSGAFDANWEIFGDAHQEVEGGPFWVKLRHKKYHMSKEVQLSDLKLWNS